MLTVRLPEEIEARLQALAKATGRSKSYYARQAIVEKLEEMEDAYLGAAVLERIRTGQERILSSADLWHDLDCAAGPLVDFAEQWFREHR